MSHFHLRALAALVAACAALCSASAHAQAVANPFEITRTSAFTYHTSGTTRGMLRTEKVEPDAPNQCLESTHGYDPYGNKNAYTPVPGAVPSGLTTKNCSGATGRAVFPQRTSGSGYGEQTVTLKVGTESVSVTIPAGTFPTVVANALGQTETREYDPRFGAVTKLTGPNGLPTVYQVDDFGRVIRETRVDDTYTLTEYCLIIGRASDTTSNTANCGTTATAPLSSLSDEIPDNAYSYVETTVKDKGDSVMAPPSRVYQDREGRTVRTVTAVAMNDTRQPSNRQWIVQDTEYSATGVAVVKTQPYFLESKSSTLTGSNDYGLEITTVDALGRPVQIDVADAQGNVASSTQHGRTRVWARTSVEYDALTVVTTNPKGQTRKEEKNADGKVVRVTDAYGAQLIHQHDATGNLLQTKDALENLVTLSYDTRGRKLSLSDPDTGNWEYDYNALGELVWQRSPNQRKANAQTTMAYDKLGRMVQRGETNEGSSTWKYDSDSNGNNCGASIGKLCVSTTAAGVTKQYHYDSKGRPDWSRTLVTNGPSFETWLTYNATNGRVSSQIYPSRLSIGYAYSSYGAVLHVALNNSATITPLPASVGGSPGTNVSWSSGRALLVAGAVTAWGKPARTDLGGVQMRFGHDAASGRLLAAGAGTGSANTVVDQAYSWDALNNLSSRIDRLSAGGGVEISETFAYDDINRLTSYRVAAPAVPGGSRTVTLKYNAIGNLLYKSDVGNYSYPAYGNDNGVTRARPHAVSQVNSATLGTINYTYDDNGNAITASGGKWRNIAYNSFNLPNGSNSGGIAGANSTPRSSWHYDENQQRIKETRTTAAGTRTTWYLHPDNQGGLAFESETAPDGKVSHRHYVSLAGQTAVLISTAALPTLSSSPPTTPPSSPAITLVKVEYWLKDHLGSIVATLDHTDAVTARYAYDPFGQRRYVNGTYDAFGNLVIDWSPSVNHGTDRGFTGHEHLDDLGLVHMNGRLYDPMIGRFLQGDPFIQSPDELQNYNRYTYCFNNGLNCTDPSGLFFKWLVRKVLRIAYELSGVKLLGMKFQDYKILLSFAASVVLPGPGGLLAGLSPVAQAAIAGFTSGAIASGGDFQAAVQGAFTGALFAGVGDMFANGGSLAHLEGAARKLAQVALHGVVGCVTSVTGGGKCGPGALSAAFSKAATVTGLKFDGYAGAISSAIIGGTASKLAGGKFANGAVTAAAGYLFNSAMHAARAGAPVAAGGAAAAGPSVGERLALAIDQAAARVGDVIDYIFKSDSVQLARNMVQDTDLQREPGQHAHHIVAVNDPRAAPARQVLDAVKMDINSAHNGVFLDASQHARTHTNVYYAAVNLALTGAATYDDVASRLNLMRTAIQTGAFPR